MSDVTISPSLRAAMALEKNAFRTAHSLGQNFLLDEDILEGLLDAAQLCPEDNILEIGPGAGVMTALMAKRAKRVLAIELDERLRPVLQAVLEGCGNACVTYADAMRADLCALTGEAFAGEPFRAVANLPYYITSDVIRRLLTLSAPLQDLCVMVQKEAAQRILSQPGEKNWCALAATVQFFGEVSVLEDVPRHWFSPQPHVDSQFLRIGMKKTRVLEDALSESFLKMVDCAFFMRRKTLQNNLKAFFAMPQETAAQLLSECGLSSTIRGEALSLEELARLTRAWKEAECEGAIRE